MAQLAEINAEITEYSGIKPNPIVDDVMEAVRLGQKKQIDVVIAVGGGSVIDSAKVIACCLPGNHDAWDVMKGKVRPVSSLPLINVLTLAATGTEMNPYAVLQNNITKEKVGFGTEMMFPKYSFLDPEFTYSVPVDQTANGITDLIAHSLEAWFGKGDSPLADRIIISVIKEAMLNAPLVLKEPYNYDYRANILLASTLALNGITVYGRSYQDWGAHAAGHILSLLYDIPHGSTLSIVYPAWLKIHSNTLQERIVQLGQELFGVASVDDTIKGLEDFFFSIKCPIRLSQLNLKGINQKDIFELMCHNKVNGIVHKMQEQDYKKLVDLML